MRGIKKKWMLPVIVFFIGMAILGITVYGEKCIQQKQSRKMADLNAMTYAERMKTDIMQGIDVTVTLEQMLISENGRIQKFSETAANMITDSIQSIQIAPDGVVTEIYPEEDNETGKIDLIHDEARGKISCYARDNHVLIMQGPFQLKQGGYGIAVRKPVYLEDESGQEFFWGFTIVIIRVPEIFSDSVKSLSDFGYQYCLSKTGSPWEEAYEVVDCSGGSISAPVSYTFEIGGSVWKLEVMPQNGWVEKSYLYSIFGGGLLIVLLLTGLTAALLILDENRQELRKLALTDALTGIYNRHGFDKHVTVYMKKYPEKHCVGVQFDIDDFKLINHIYGHASGDKALQILAKSMRKFFPEHAVLGRNGGDEFCIFLPDCTCKEAEEKLVQFTKQKRFFVYEGEERAFNISLGYAEYPVHAKSQLQLMHCADAALYEVKLRGKKGSLVYDEGFDSEVRTQLGFALRDISENLPGAFIIYKADYTDDEILFANSELIRLAGCENIEEFMTYTQRSFRSLIREDEREGVEQSIWQQIGTGQCNDYVHFYLKKKDGTYLKVLDHGRIVESGHYGKVFYVLIMDWDSMKEKYRDSL
mgnify:CR=1 FL=1